MLLAIRGPKLSFISSTFKRNISYLSSLSSSKKAYHNPIRVTTVSDISLQYIHCEIKHKVNKIRMKMKKQTDTQNKQCKKTQT